MDEDKREDDSMGFAMEDLFIGSSSGYQKFKKQHNVEEVDEPTPEEEPEKQKITPKIVISKATLKELDEEHMTILRRTRCAHDYGEVYMQSSLEFYDQYYNDTEASPELKAARQIRRIYTSYTDYLNAIETRNAYLDTLIEKYGEDKFMNKLAMGLVREWIPPIPTLSKRSPDYEMYLSGVIPIETEVLPEGTTKEVLEAMQEEVKDVELVQTSSVETSIGMIRMIDEIIDEEYNGGYNKYQKGNSITNLDDLNRVFRSWYKPDVSDTNRVMFKNAPENIKKRYEESLGYAEPGLLTRIMNGEEDGEVIPNPNEMVHDPVTGRSMTRKEYDTRCTIRMLARSGWSESRLLAYFNVGSTLGKQKRKRKASKKRRRDTNETGGDIASIYGAPVLDNSGMDPLYVDSQELQDAIANLMRGD